MEREREINVGEDEVMEEREEENPVLILDSKRANSGKWDVWLRSSQKTDRAARILNPLGRIPQTARAVGSREQTFGIHKFQPEDPLRTEKKLRMVHFSDLKSSETKA